MAFFPKFFLLQVQPSSANPQYAQAVHTGRTVTLHRGDANANPAATGDTSSLACGVPTDLSSSPPGCACRRLGEKLGVQLSDMSRCGSGVLGLCSADISGTCSNTLHGARILRAIPGCSACAGGKQHLSTTKYQFTPSLLLVLVAKFSRMLTKVQTRGVP